MEKKTSEDMEQSAVSKEKVSKGKRTLKIIADVLIYIFICLCIVALFFAIGAKRSEDGAVTIFGREMRIVLSGSMEKSDMTDVSGFEIKSIPVKSVIVTERVPTENQNEWYKDLKEGDVLTFRYRIAGSMETITHRIIKIIPYGDGYEITLRGDNRAENEATQVINTTNVTSPDHVIGKVVWTSAALGNVIYFLQQPVGIAFVVIVPAVIIVILQVIKVVSIVGAEKRRKVEESSAKKDTQIEELKKRLAAAEGRQVPEECPETEQNDTGEDQTAKRCEQ